MTLQKNFITLPSARHMCHYCQMLVVMMIVFRKFFAGMEFQIWDVGSDINESTFSSLGGWGMILAIKRAFDTLDAMGKVAALNELQALRYGCGKVTIQSKNKKNSEVLIQNRQIKEKLVRASLSIFPDSIEMVQLWMNGTVRANAKCVYLGFTILPRHVDEAWYIKPWALLDLQSSKNWREQARQQIQLRQQQPIDFVACQQPPAEEPGEPNAGGDDDSDGDHDGAADEADDGDNSDDDLQYDPDKVVAARVSEGMRSAAMEEVVLQIEAAAIAQYPAPLDGGRSSEFVIIPGTGGKKISRVQMLRSLN